MNYLDHANLRRVISSLAGDVQDRYTLNEHIHQRVQERAHQRTRLIEIVAEAFGFEGSGYESQVVFLDHLHSLMGYTHQQLLSDLRRIAQEQDPRESNHAYGYARRSPADRIHSLGRGPSLTDREQSGHPAGDPRLLINNADLLAIADEVSRD